MVETRLIDVDGLQALVDGLVARGFTVIGPTVRGGAHRQRTRSRSVEDLPRGWGDDQGPARYRLRRRDDEALFGFAAGAQSAKPVFFPADELLWRGRRTTDGRGFEVDRRLRPAPAQEDRARRAPRRAVLRPERDRHPRHGARRTSRGRRALRPAPRGRLRRRGRVLRPRRHLLLRLDGHRVRRPEAGRGAPFDLCLTELLDGGHRFVVEVGSDRGAELLDAIGAPPAAPTDEEAAARRQRAGERRRMGRRLDTDGIKDLLYASVDSPRWDDVASRCLSCTNCTMVCPTCFCTTVEDVSDLTGQRGRAPPGVGLLLRRRLLLHPRRRRPRVGEVALPAVDDPQAGRLAGPVRHLGLRGLRPVHHLVPGRHRHHRGGRGAARCPGSNLPAPTVRTPADRPATQ